MIVQGINNVADKGLDLVLPNSINNGNLNGSDWKQVLLKGGENLDPLKVELYKSNIWAVVGLLFSLYFIYLGFGGDKTVRNFRKWAQIMFKLFSIAILYLAIYFAYGPIKDTIDFKPIEKQIIVKEAGFGSWMDGLVMTTIEDLENNSYYLYKVTRFSKERQVT